MIKLFDLPKFKIDSENLDHILHSSDVSKFENDFASYVGAKYACSVNSATNAIFLALKREQPTNIQIPSMIPPVVCNAIIQSGCNYSFYDDINWVGNSYILHDFDSYKIIDSAQCVVKNQFRDRANDNDLMIFSFYPTKPIAGSDGGMIVSNDINKINWFKMAVLNGTTFSIDNWDRKILFPGYKMYMNSIQSSICQLQLEKYDDKLKRLESIRNFYNSEFDLNNQSHHLYRIIVNDNIEAMNLLKNKNIQTGIHYKALHLHEVYKTFDKCPLSEEYQNKFLSIPFNSSLTDEEIEIVVNETKKIQSRCN